MIAILLIAAAVAVGAIVVGGGGHTVEGFGKDLEHSGEHIQQNTGQQ